MTETNMQIREIGIADASVFRCLRLEALKCEPDAFAESPDEFAQKSIEELQKQISESYRLGSCVIGVFDSER
jgi:hypothetical protein